MPELWRPVLEWPGYYASMGGDVLGPGGKVLKPWADRRGRPMVALHRGGKQHTRRVCQVVAAAYLGIRPADRHTCHSDGDNGQNGIGNLYYGTRSQNMRDAVRHGTHFQSGKVECVNGHKFSPENTRHARGQRFCRACDRDRRRGQ